MYSIIPRNQAKMMMTDISNDSSNDKENTLIINQELSIYIPYIHSSEDEIISAFDNLGIGIVKRVDLVCRGLDVTTSMAFIHMEKWNETKLVENIQSKMISTDMEARVVYDDPKYWILLPNKNPVLVKPTEEIDTLKSEIANLHNIIKNLSESLSNMEVQNKNIAWMTRLHDVNINYICNDLAALKVNNNYKTENHVYNNTPTNTNDITENVMVKHENVDNDHEDYYSDEDNAKKHNYTPRDLWMRRLRPRFTQ